MLFEKNTYSSSHFDFCFSLKETPLLPCHPRKASNFSRAAEVNEDAWPGPFEELWEHGATRVAVRWI